MVFLMFSTTYSWSEIPPGKEETTPQNKTSKISVATSYPEAASFSHVKSDDELLYIQDPNPEIDPEGKTPIVMVHGWSFQGRPAAPGTGYWDFFKSYLLNDFELRKHFKPYYVKYWSNAVSIQELGTLLRDKLQEEGLHQQPFVMIAHSMGGLVSRSFMIENTYTSGSYSGRQCGDNVKLLITLGSPHHGSPMANGPARDNEVNFILQLTMATIEGLVFKETTYDEVNRSNLRWDNYDGLLDYNKYPDERNDWLVNLNTHVEFDQKMVCYAGTVNGEFLFPPIETVEQQYKVGAYIMEESFGFDNDGIVPCQSAAFEGHTPKRVRYFAGYNHADIVTGKEGNNDLFNRFKTDLLETVPIELDFPNGPDIVQKHSTPLQITWSAPSRVNLINLYYSCDNGLTYSPIASSLNASSGAYNWAVPDTNSTQCLVKITNQEKPGGFVVSETAFTIYHNRLTFISPVANGYFAPGKANTINWFHEGIGENVKITYTDTENDFELVVAENATTVPGNNTYEWMHEGEVPPTRTANITVELLGIDALTGDTEIYRCQSDPFLYLGQPAITLLTPNSNPVDPFGIEGEQMFIDSLCKVTWETEGEINFVRINLCDSEKNVLAELKKKNHKPGFASQGNLNWKIPEYYGDRFYLFLEAGADIHTITATTCSEYPFRINRMPKMVSPQQNETGIGFLPCIEIEPLTEATAYSIKITDAENDGSIYNNRYMTDTCFFCLPNGIENELLPGTEYELSAWAFFDTVQSYGIKAPFETGEFAPESFSIVLPMAGDTLVEPEYFFEWERATGAQGYRLSITHREETVFEGNYTKADTQAVINFGNVQYDDTLFCEITAYNNFGETIAVRPFYKKFRAGIKQTALNKTYGLKVFPNPVSDVAVMEFVLPNRGEAYSVKTMLSTSNGQVIYEKNEMKFFSGRYRFVINRSMVKTEGLHFLSLWVEGNVETVAVVFDRVR
jgi:pimeloyl-ACP methyl ester carboxylesterase